MTLGRLFVALIFGIVPLRAQNAPITAQPLRPQAAIRTEPARAEPLRPTPPPPQVAPATPAPIAPAPATTPAPTAPGTPAPVNSAVPAAELQIQPSWETQKHARTYAFTIPAPRGLITDRHGVPLAQTRVAYNLAIQFPTPLEFSDTQAGAFVEQQANIARQILKQQIPVDAERALKHYKNRGIMPLVILQDLKAEDVEAIRRSRAPALMLQPVYQRFYPQGTSAAHVVGYVGRQGGLLTGVVENNEMLWPGTEGREGLEKTFNEQLTGKPGVLHVSFDAQGRRSNERISQPPIPGQNVITTIDLKLQGLIEQSILSTKRPGAMVLTDPHTGEILAMASVPSYDPNAFIPSITTEEFDALRNDPAAPLFPRAYQSAYPPGSTFKVITGLAAMNDGYIEPDDQFEGPPSMMIGNREFHNHTKKHQGLLDFPRALTVSCNTYFYQIGLKSGHKPILEYASRLGIGRKVGLPLAGDENGNLMTDDYMMKVHKRHLMPGDVANLSIGQGDLLVTPLQMAHAMASIGNGGTVYQPRLVLQVQGVDQKISLGFEIRVRDHLEIDPAVMHAVRVGMVGVVQGRGGTATNAAVPGVLIAAKTGTAQWGAGKNEKVAAWFVGFAPADRPRYAFAAVYEGKEARNDVHGGSHAAPIVSRVLKDILKPEVKDKQGGLRKKRKPAMDEESEDDEGMEMDPPPRPRIIRQAPVIDEF